MSDFIQQFKSVIESKPIGNRARFSEMAGVSTAYLSDIFNGHQLPKPATLDLWLERAAVPNKDRLRLVYLCSLEKARESEDMRPLLDHLARRDAEITGLIQALVTSCEEAGAKIPKDLRERIKAL